MFYVLILVWLINKLKWNEITSQNKEGMEQQSIICFARLKVYVFKRQTPSGTVAAFLSVLAPPVFVITDWFNTDVLMRASVLVGCRSISTWYTWRRTPASTRWYSCLLIAIWQSFIPSLQWQYATSATRRSPSPPPGSSSSSPMHRCYPCLRWLTDWVRLNIPPNTL